MTFNDLNLEMKAKLKKFFYNTEAQIALQENNFDKLFGMWEDKSYPLNRNMVNALRALLDYTHIDYLQYMTRIPNYFYCDDEDIEEFIIPENIAVIGRTAFYHCPNLLSVKLPKSIVKIEGGAFSGRPSKWPRLSLYYDGTKEEWHQIKTITGDQLYGNSIVNCTDGEVKRFTL